MLYIIINDYNRYKLNNKQLIFIKNTNKYTNPILFLINLLQGFKSDDIIYFINNKSTKEFNYDNIYKLKLKLNKKILFARLNKPTNNIEKYLQDKKYKRCDKYHINSNFFIGNVSNILNFLSSYKQTYDFQTYTIHNYSSTIIEIDYNYKFFPNVHYTNNSKITDFKFECIFIGLCLYILKNIPNRINALLICITLYIELIHYELFVKHVDISHQNKILYILLEFFHNCVLSFVIYLLLNHRCNNKKLLLLNILYMLIIYLFFIYKRCVLTIIENKLLNIDTNYGSISRNTRLMYMFDIDIHYFPQKGNNLYQWINGNTFTIIVILLSNIYCLYKIK